MNSNYFTADADLLDNSHPSWKQVLPENVLNAVSLPEEGIYYWCSLRHKWSFTEVAENWQDTVERLEVLVLLSAESYSLTELSEHHQI